MLGGGELAVLEQYYRNGQTERARNALADLLPHVQAEERAQVLLLQGQICVRLTLRSDSVAFRDGQNYLNEALVAARGTGNPALLGTIQLVTAALHDEAGLFGAALGYYQKTLELAELNALHDLHAQAFTGLARHFLYQRDLTATGKYLQAARERLRLGVSGGDSVVALSTEAWMLFVAGEYDRAEIAASEAASWYEADHGLATYTYALAEALGLELLVLTALAKAKQAANIGKRLKRLVSSFDAPTVQAFEARLERLNRLHLSSIDPSSTHE